LRNPRFTDLLQQFKRRFHRHHVLRALAIGIMVGVGMALFVPMIAGHSELLVVAIAGIGATLLMLFLD